MMMTDRPLFTSTPFLERISRTPVPLRAVGAVALAIFLGRHRASRDRNRTDARARPRAGCRGPGTRRCRTAGWSTRAARYPPRAEGHRTARPIEDNVACAHGHGTLGIKAPGSEGRLQRGSPATTSAFSSEKRRRSPSWSSLRPETTATESTTWMPTSRQRSITLSLVARMSRPHVPLVHVARKAVEGEVHARETCGDKVFEIAFLVRDDQAVRVDLDAPETLLASHADDLGQILAARGNRRP